MYGNAMFGGQDFGNMMQSTQNNFASSIPPINVGYYNAMSNNPATYQQPTEPQQMDPMQYQQYMQQQYQQQINPQQQAMPAQQDMGMAGQLANQPLRFRNPDFYSEQRYLGFQPGGVQYQRP